MTDQVDSLLINVRASTQGFAQDVSAMRSTFDGTLVDGFTKGGTALETSLTSAIKKGSSGFDDLQKVAVSALNTIASQSMRSLFGSSSPTGAASSAVGGLLGSLLGLPGRATGGPVSPGSAYLVGERGPEVF